MSGYAQALIDDYGPTLDPEANSRLARIQRASHRLDLLIRDVLAYSTVSKSHLELVPVPLENLVADVIEQHPEFADNRAQIHIAGPLLAVLGHEACLAQTFSNLISNGLKFVSPGQKPSIQISSETVGDWVRIYIKDQGIGIGPEHHDRIFQIFGRVYSDKAFEGTGIGLAIVKKAVSRMGGEVGFNSESGHGTEFWISLKKALT